MVMVMWDSGGRAEKVHGGGGEGGGRYQEGC